LIGVKRPDLPSLIRINDLLLITSGFFSSTFSSFSSFSSSFSASILISGNDSTTSSFSPSLFNSGTSSDSSKLSSSETSSSETSRFSSLSFSCSLLKIDSAMSTGMLFTFFLSPSSSEI